MENSSGADSRERGSPRDRSGLCYSDPQQLLSIKIAGEREWGGFGGGSRDGGRCHGERVPAGIEY